MKSQNTFVGKHWTVKHADREMWKQVVALVLRDNPVPKAAGRRSIVVILHSAREVDCSNVLGGAKGLIDSLVEQGLLIDDRPKYLKPATGDWEKLLPGEQPHTVVILEDVA